MMTPEVTRRRGSPLALLGLLVAVWIGGRVVLWESPFPAAGFALPEAASLIAENSTGVDGPAVAGTDRKAALIETRFDRHKASGHDRSTPRMERREARSYAGGFAWSGAHSVFREGPSVAAGHNSLLAAALRYAPMPRTMETTFAPRGSNPLLAAPGRRDGDWPLYVGSSEAKKEGGAKPDRWSLDAWAFWRQGSNATAVSQGRVPIYGASQVGASLQYRLAPTSKRDPRVYLRGYSALVNNGETEGAVGFSARPVGNVPLRAFAEVRTTDTRFGTDVRPSGFVVTELPQQRLPLGVVAEAYAQAGYVGGNGSTPFADGQIVVAREVLKFDLATQKPARVSVGAGVWGGAQEGAARVDVGPTLRVDTVVGDVPARLSVDWREQVAGDASPGSGAAVTLSTRF